MKKILQYLVSRIYVLCFFRQRERFMYFKGKISLACARFLWYCSIDRSVSARGVPDIVNGGMSPDCIVMEEGVSLNSDSRTCRMGNAYGPVKVRTFGKSARVIIKKNASINSSSIVARSKKIVIGEDTMIAPNCVIVDTDFHDAWPSKGRRKRLGAEKDRDVVIGKNVWICTGSIILKGSVIGDNSIIAAGSVVNSIIPPGSIAGGGACEGNKDC